MFEHIWSDIGQGWPKFDPNSHNQVGWLWTKFARYVGEVRPTRVVTKSERYCKRWPSLRSVGLNVPKLRLTLCQGLPTSARIDGA